MEKEINILIDFNSYSPLVLFDENTKFENEEDEKKQKQEKWYPIPWKILCLFFCAAAMCLVLCAATLCTFIIHVLKNSTLLNKFSKKWINDLVLKYIHNHGIGILSSLIDWIDWLICAVNVMLPLSAFSKLSKSFWIILIN